MSLKSAIQTAMTHALNRDSKAYDPAQVMNQAPYSYVVADTMRDLLLDVAHELATDVPPAILNIGSLDLDNCMKETEADLEADIYSAIPPTS